MSEIPDLLSGDPILAIREMLAQLKQELQWVYNTYQKSIASERERYEQNLHDIERRFYREKDPIERRIGAITRNIVDIEALQVKPKFISCDDADALPLPSPPSQEENR